MRLELQTNWALDLNNFGYSHSTCTISLIEYTQFTRPFTAEVHPSVLNVHNMEDEIQGWDQKSPAVAVVRDGCVNSILIHVVQ